MSVTKRIVILASSARAGNLCVAGKELLDSGDSSKWNVGNWVRLANPKVKEGAVTQWNMMYNRLERARVRDIVEVEFDSYCNDPNHPEDWFINPEMRPKKIGRYSFDQLKPFIDTPKTLWHEGDDKSVPLGHVPAMECPATLYLIRAPKNTRVEYWREDNPFESGRYKNRRQVHLRYAEIWHEFSFTDPEFTKRHGVFDKIEMDKKKQIVFQSPEDVLLCLSLTAVYEKTNKHYKMAATIFEPNV